MRDPRITSSTIPRLGETGNARFFNDVECVGGDKIRDFVFEEECVNIPTVAIDNYQTSITNIVQEVNLDQDNDKEPPIPNQEIVTEEQTLQPQEPMPLRRSTRERRSAVPKDYIVFLQEHKIDIGVAEEYPTNFRQAMESSNSQK